MFIEFCKSKLAHGYITEAKLHYEGSITIDEDLLDAVGIIPGEKVEVLKPWAFLISDAGTEKYALTTSKLKNFFYWKKL